MKKILSILSLMIFMAGCAEFEAPDRYTPVTMEANTTIKAFKALYSTGPTKIVDDIIISGVVNSSDKDGNIYRTLYIQDETGGLEVKVGKTGLYNIYKEGMTLYIKAKDLVLGAYGGVVGLGAASTEDKYETSYLDVQHMIDTHIFKGEVGEKIQPKVLTSGSEVKDALLGTLVTLQGVTYSGGDNVTIGGKLVPLTTWAVSSSKNEGNALSGNQNFSFGGTKIVVRSSGYAKFADEEVAIQEGGRANLTGILTKYYSTYQLVLLSVDGVEVL